MADAEDNKTLDLDALFGQAKPVKVKLNGKEYELLPMEGIGPRQAVQFQKLQLKAQKLQRLQTGLKEMDAKQAKELEELFNEMLRTLCPELPLAEMNTMQKIRTIVFYMEETQGKKILEKALGNLSIGATPSPN